MRSTHSQRLERWLGTERVEQISQQMKGWYGPPIHLLDCPGSVRVCGDGDFIGPFERGYFHSALDSLSDWTRRVRRARVPFGEFHAGFTSISSALAQASQGLTYQWNVLKSGSTGVLASTNTLWRVGSQPAGGSAGAAAPGGTAHTDADTGALPFTNPAAGTTRLTGADFACSVANNTLLLYDRLFSVAKTMSSTGTESVTGVPSRYQSTTGTNEDYIGGNFGFIEIFAALGATAHNWTTCTYTNQAGTTSVTLPSVTGLSSGIIDRLDQPASTWFVPLASGDTGIAAWDQMQCSASVTGSINFCIGHPIGFMSFPLINTMLPFDWLTNRLQVPRIFDNACLAFLEILKPATTATTYTGAVYATVAP